MATVSRVKTWNANETLTAADLNAEFNNILNGINSNSLDSSNLDATDTYVMAELVVGSGISNADGGQLHVHTASAGAVTASVEADEAVFENSGNAGITILAGTTNNAAIYFGDSGDNDIGKIDYDHNTNTLAITTNAATAITIDSSQQVGIGTASPGSQVHIQAATTAAMKIENTGDGKVNIQLDADRPDVGDSLTQIAFQWNGSNIGRIVGLAGDDNSNKDEGDIQIQTYAAGVANTGIYLNQEGNVGIGTTSPDGNLHVHDATAGSVTASTAANVIVAEDSANNGISILTPDANTGILAYGSPSDSFGAALKWTHDDNEFILETANAGGFLTFKTANQSTAMSIDASGNVGIGETAPDALLTMNQGTGDGSIFTLKSSDVGHGRTGVAETDTYFLMKKSSATLGGCQMSFLAEDAAHTQPAYFVSEGGTADTTKTTSAVGLFTMFAREHNGANSVANITADGNVFVVQARVSNSNVARFMIDEDGDRYIAGSENAFSDRRIKTNFENQPYGLSEVLATPTHKFDKYDQFDFNDSGELEVSGKLKTQIGFVAQEIQKTMPMLIKDVDILTVRQEWLMPVLWKAVQELSAEVTALKEAA